MDPVASQPFELPSQATVILSMHNTARNGSPREKTCAIDRHLSGLPHQPQHLPVATRPDGDRFGLERGSNPLTSSNGSEYGYQMSSNEKSPVSCNTATAFASNGSPLPVNAREKANDEQVVPAIKLPDPAHQHGDSWPAPVKGSDLGLPPEDLFDADGNDLDTQLYMALVSPPASLEKGFLPENRLFQFNKLGGCIERAESSAASLHKPGDPAVCGFDFPAPTDRAWESAQYFVSKNIRHTGLGRENEDDTCLYSRRSQRRVITCH
ncbi:hypothetical protein CIB48_g5736 [Xylaria polymorpha]|nr:hypothetical protein CIB48_g5736 [Xylaria polymorpha]